MELTCWMCHVLSTPPRHPLPCISDSTDSCRVGTVLVVVEMFEVPQRSARHPAEQMRVGSPLMLPSLMVLHL